MTRPTASLLVTTYEWPEALAAVLRSIEAQHVLPDEVIVADDGSGERTRRLVEEAQLRFPVPLHHVWQPDDGFRAARIRNMASARAAGAYLVQVDGDMVLHPDFVRDHLAAATPGYFVGGSRVMLGPRATARVIAGARVGPLSRDVRNRLNAIRLPTLGRALARASSPRSLSSVRSANVAYWRDDFLAVNGYDEVYVGWGREDTDLVVRLHRHGLRRRFFKLQGIAYHLHHREAPRERLRENDALLERSRQTTSSRCAVGVSQHLEDPGGAAGATAPPSPSSAPVEPPR